MARVSEQVLGEELGGPSPSVGAAGSDEPGADGIGLTAAPTALPSVLARALAFAAIVIAAVCGGLAGYATSALQCSAGCVGPTLGGTAIGALVAAAGVAALAALVLRSMSEWADQASAQTRRNGSRSRRGPSSGRSGGGGTQQ